MNKVKIAAIQYDIESGEKEKNMTKATDLLEKAAKEKVDIIAFPEYFLTGFPITKKNVQKWAEPIPGPLTDSLSQIAEKYHVFILGSLLEKEHNNHFATCPLIGPDGKILGKHRKVNFWMMYPCDEVGAGLKSGTDYTVLATDLLNIGILLGDDFVTPESLRICALKNADVIFYITGVEYPWRNVVFRISQASAYVNLLYVILVNRTGKFDNIGFFGESSIIDPFGDIITSAGPSYETLHPEGIAIGTIDLTLLRNLRRQLWNPLRLRKPKTYGLLIKEDLN